MSSDLSDSADEVPDGAALFPEIPTELGVHPLLLAMLHAYVFLDGSDAAVVNPEASSEAMEYVASYLQRLDGPELQRAREDFDTLVGYAKEQKWPKQYVVFLKSFLSDNGVGGEMADDQE
ncbi:MAG TPA: hypothetical protein VHR66_12835 [Gemmataceae bacterium]|jgi:hypothetical protein|nr:hypothetical protein [Gemmataceae bacterium]